MATATGYTFIGSDINKALQEVGLPDTAPVLVRRLENATEIQATTEVPGLGSLTLVLDPVVDRGAKTVSQVHAGLSNYRGDTMVAVQTPGPRQEVTAAVSNALRELLSIAEDGVAAA